MSNETPVYENVLAEASAWLKNNAMLKGRDATEDDLQLNEANGGTIGSVGFNIRNNPVRQKKLIGWATPVIVGEMTRQALSALHNTDVAPIYAAKAFRQAKAYNKAMIDSLGDYKMSKLYPETYTTMTEVAATPDVSDRTYLRGMFEGCAAITAVPNDLDSGRAIDMREMFKGCTALADATHVSTDNAQKLDGMFDGCVSLASVPAIDTSRAKSMREMFKDCTALTAGPDVDTSKSGDLSFFLYNCSEVISIPAYNISRSYHLGYMLSGTKISSVPSLNMAMAKDTEGMFKGCTNITSIIEVNTENAESMDMMFYGCTQLTSIGSIDTRKAVSASGMFNGCYSLTSLPVLDVSKLQHAGNTSKYNSITMQYEEFGGMFQGCSALTKITLKNPHNISNASQMFSGCSSLTIINGVGDMKPGNMKSMFLNCSSITSIEVNTENATDIQNMFEGCTSLTTLPVLDMSSMTTKIAKGGSETSYYFSNAFKGCTALTSVTFKNASAELQALLTAENLGNPGMAVNFE